jgi:hypothetical protein
MLYALLASRPEVAEASPILELEAKLAGSEENNCCNCSAWTSSRWPG